MKRLIAGLTLVAALNGCKTEAEKNLERFVEAVPQMKKEYGCIGEGCFDYIPFDTNDRINLYVQDKASMVFLEKCSNKPLTKEQMSTPGLASDIAADEGAKALIFDGSALGLVAAIVYNPSNKNKQGGK